MLDIFDRNILMLMLIESNDMFKNNNTRVGFMSSWLLLALMVISATSVK